MHANSSRTQGLIAINIAAIIFGSSALFGKLDVSPFWIVAMRAGFAAITLLVLSIIKRDIGLPSRYLWKPTLISGLTLALHWITFFISVQFAGIAIATLTFAAFPLFTVLIESLHQKRNPRPVELAASIAIIVAVAILVGPGTQNNSVSGTIIGLVSALAFAWFGIASKKLGQELSPLRISFVQNTVVAIALIPCLILATPAPAHVSDWAWLILLGVLNTALMHQLYFYALKRLSASTCSGFVALEPVYAILFAAYFFGEPITLWTALSSFLIVGASFALLRYEKFVAGQ